MVSISVFVFLGVIVGSFGTLIGAGGGFLLTPILLIYYPTMSAQTITAISMTTVFFNSSSGSFAYARMKRIDYKTGIIFALATLPCSIIGTILTTMMPREMFDTIFGASMLIFASFIILKSRMGNNFAPIDKKGNFRAIRRLIDGEGNEAAFSFNMLAGVLISLMVGFLSGLLGIGGGIVHVPALVFLGFPAHFATATSHFVLVFSSLTSLLVHLTASSLVKMETISLSIAIGSIIGAQIGARISKRIKGSVIMLSLAAALVFAGGRILYKGLVGLWF
ncbi:sulfite exporter TauE/SafE family protein [Desulfosporosinus sp. BG]|uniref:sulfite exporter TauE/SafE family protein n=1 Tax=Desulfosporosinus sp. BG TaxID=1633135 RepID=UPI00083B9312|nr:sulfite exporter TauE/SafE family protein [Desulfosporosinus sp. BG]